MALNDELRNLFEMAADPDKAYRVEDLISHARLAITIEHKELIETWAALSKGLSNDQYSQGRRDALQQCTHDLRFGLKKEASDVSDSSQPA